MKILICGSQEFEDYNFLAEICTDIMSKIQYDNVLGDTIRTNEIEIVSGHAARGGDHYGEKFAKKNNLKLKLFPARWNDLNVPVVSIGKNYYGDYNKLAGMQRNSEMIQYVSEDNGIVIAFRMKNSKGTTDTIAKAKKAGLKTFQIDYDKDKKMKVWN